MSKRARKRRQYLARRKVEAIATKTGQQPQVRAPERVSQPSQALSGLDYVRKDLRQAGLLTAGTIVILVILALVLG